MWGGVGWPRTSNLGSYIPTWEGGILAAFDLAITSPHRADILANAARTAGAAATQYEETKRTFLNTATVCTSQGNKFLPLVAETSGGWGPAGLKTLSKLAKRRSHTFVVYISTLKTGSYFDVLFYPSGGGNAINFHQILAKLVEEDPAVDVNVRDVEQASQLPEYFQHYSRCSLSR